MAGIVIQKNYVTTSISNANVANNWMVLVYGVTSQGATTPTLVQNYNTFTTLFGQPVKGVLTHAYVRFLLENGVSVLFQRVIDTDPNKFKAASATISRELESQNYNLFTVTATDTYKGSIGNNISIEIKKSATTGVCTLEVKLLSTGTKSEVKETFPLGQVTSSTEIGNLVYDFIDKASKSTSDISNYVKFQMGETNVDVWKNYFPISEVHLEGGIEPSNDLDSALKLLSDEKSPIYNNVKLLHAPTYYPQLRFATTGGLCYDSSVDGGTDNQNKMLTVLGKFATKAQSSFRVLIDYSKDMTDIATVRTFANSITDFSTAIYSYFGFWGADSYNNWLPGSAGFLTGIARSGYNVYSRRIAGSGFSPAFTKSYKNIYIDAIKDWQAEDLVQVNPMVIIDAQDNLAIMGSSTLAAPSGALSSRNPMQALDIVCVGDYVAAILNNIALGELEAALDRLSLSSLSNRMDQELERFVTSNAITRYDLNFDTTQLGKLGIECILYFAIGLEEVSLTVTSIYDTNIIS